MSTLKTNRIENLTTTDGGISINNSGEVGIGTTSPSDTLHVSSGRIRIQPGTDADAIRIQPASNTDTNYIAFRQADNGLTKGYIGYIHADTAMTFRSTGSGEQMRIDSNGRVGIGTQSPSSELQVNGDSDTQIRVVCSSGGSAGIQFGDTGDVVRGGVNFDATGNNLTLRGYNNTERLRIDSSGRVLVGTTSARTFVGSALNSQFQIEGTNDDTSIASITRNSNNTGAGRLIFAKSRGTTDGAVTVVQSGDNLGSILFEGADGTDTATAGAIDCVVDTASGSNDMPGRLVFSTTADGASSPTERLRITATGKLKAPEVYNQTTTTGGNVYVQSDGDILRFTSSAKYKTDVETIEDARADAILNCRPVWYRSTCESDITTEGSEKSDWGWYGFIAEEVAEIEPRLVNWATKDAVEQEDGSMESVQRDPADYTAEGVRYETFVPLLVNLVKRQQAAIETLETQNADLSARITALETA